MGKTNTTVIKNSGTFISKAPQQVKESKTGGKVLSGGDLRTGKK